ncbi:hypothetical protein QQ020_08005 [Fulvivirgaceae bacterium BMA12]|uniref:Lipocalin-like domain-containing protein n=1 Tax=Agaribacillus aureus TaxID=3051825 RepID=A0ABT8L2J9_9BACT|nr:hypothetical protein [Fulvivirgaceae bacterium BMA12]
MKRINFLLTAGFILSLLVYTGCGSSSADPETAAEIQLKKLQGTWAATANSVKRDNKAEPTYDNFTVTFAGTLNADKSNVETTSTYNTNDQTNAFPTGTWSFDGTSVTTILRGTGIRMTITTLTDTNLLLTFSLNQAGTANRTAGLEGSWTFDLTKQ